MLNSQVGFTGLWICLSVISKVNQQFLVCGRQSDGHSGHWFINSNFFQIHFVPGLGYCSRFILSGHSNQKWLGEKSVWFTYPSHRRKPGTWRQQPWKDCLLAPLMAHAQAHTSLYRPGPPAQGMMLFKVKWAFLYQLSIQTIALPRHGHRSIWCRQFLNGGFPLRWLFDVRCQFCQVDSYC